MRPRQYLSWSSLDLFERSRPRWIAHYIHGEELNFNKRGQDGIDLGRRMADALEHEEMTGDPLFDLTVANVPRFDRMEAEIRADLPRKGKDPVPLLAKLDTLKNDHKAFKEYKQGTEAWTKTKVRESGQITFYATTLYLLTGIIPDDIELIYVPTERTSDGNKMTGDIVCFKTERTMRDILAMMNRMSRAWDEMEIVTRGELL